MDDKDEKILSILRKNARTSFTEISDKLDVSEGTVRNRVEGMKKEGVIENFTVETGVEVSKAIVMVKIETGRDIENILERFPSDLRLMEVTGAYDIIIRAERNSNKEINSLLDEIRTIDGIEETQTYMVMEERH